MALRKLGYEEPAIEKILAYIDKNDTIEDCPEIQDEHLTVFDCAFKPRLGKRSINWEAHIKMMAAAQPFLSGAISKTVNMPRETTPEDIAGAYVEGWRLGLKAIAIYRDGSKESQPLSTSTEGDKNAEKAVAAPRRERLPDTRRSVTHKFNVGGHEGYITVGLYDDGRPGELFITMAKEGSTIGGLMDSFGTAVSMSLQYGVPLEVYTKKFSHTGLNHGAIPKTLIFLSRRVWWTIFSAGWEQNSCLGIVKQIDQPAVAVVGRPLQEKMERVSPSPPPRRRAGTQTGRKPPMENTMLVAKSPQVEAGIQVGEMGKPTSPLGQRHSQLQREKGPMELRLLFLNVLG